MTIDYTAVPLGSLVHGGGIGMVIEALGPETARVMSLAGDDIGQIRAWGNDVDVVNLPSADTDVERLLRTYNVGGLTEEMTSVVVRNTEAVWAEYRLAVRVPARLLGDDERLREAAIEQIDAARFEVLSGPDVRATIDRFDQEYDIEGTL